MMTPLGMEVDLGPGHVLDGDPAPREKGTAAPPSFRHMSTVAKRSPISDSVEHLYKQSPKIGATASIR